MAARPDRRHARLRMAGHPMILRLIGHFSTSARSLIELFLGDFDGFDGDWIPFEDTK